MDSWMAFGTFVALAAIALLGGALIYVLVHMIVGTFGGTKKNKKGEVLDYGEVKQLEDAKEEEYNFERIDEAKAEKEKEDSEKEDDDIFTLDEEDKKDIVEETEENKEDEEDLSIDDLIDQISDEVADEAKDEQAEANSKMSDELAAYSIDEILNQVSSEEETEENEENAETEEETETEEVEEPVEEVTEVEEPVETAENTEESEDKKVIEELKAQLNSLTQELEAARTAKVKTVSINMTEEQCVERLATLEERLKNAKRDYKITSKEYRPIKKAMTDYEKYQAKLRRKNAIVANKKLSLYGVSNYVDLDKEKAEKLTNDLELLAGLRLSVQHCEEVINANKDRFPILERTNNILEEEIANLEADIEATNKTLQLIRDKKNK